jgi:hypothetical protein
MYNIVQNQLNTQQQYNRDQMENAYYYFFQPINQLLFYD